MRDSTGLPAADGEPRMKTLRHISTAALVMTVCLAAWSSIAGAAIKTIDWLNMPPTPFGGSVPSGSVFVVAGIGNVTLTYTMGANVSDGRGAGNSFLAGSVVSGPDTYQWTDFESFTTILNSGPDPIVPVMSTITYTFTSQLTAGTVYIGALGLGATTSFGGGASTTTVNQNGTFLGDYAGSGGFGATQYTGGAGTFQMQNSVTAPGGLDPNWNTQLGVVRIDDPVTSITVFQNGIRGDGIGVNIGFIPDETVPTHTSTWGRMKTLYR
jgi:hypothetical protein